MRGSPVIIEAGHTYGQLTAIGPAPEEGKYHWKVRCSCGNVYCTSKYCIARRAEKPCGCIKVRHRPTGPLSHGQSSRGRPTPEYLCWRQMKDRCLNPACACFSYYGGRGIVICERWRDSFEAFREDMGDLPGRGYTIERNDSNGHYSCGKCLQCLREGWVSNCRWATRKEQARNTSHNRHLTVDGVTKTVGEWAEITGLGDSLYRRLYRGWDEETAVKTPLLPRGQKLKAGRGSVPA